MESLPITDFAISVVLTGLVALVAEVHTRAQLRRRLQHLAAAIAAPGVH